MFVANRLGLLHDLTALLKKGNVHVMAITVFDTTDSAIVRLIVDDPDKARDLMITNDFPYTESDVLAVEIASEADLTGVLAALLEAEINIHYIYSFIKRPADRDGARDQRRGFRGRRPGPQPARLQGPDPAGYLAVAEIR